MTPVVIYVLDTAALAASDWADFAALLPEVRQRRAANMVHEQDRCDSIAAACLSFYALAAAQEGTDTQFPSPDEIRAFAGRIARLGQDFGWQTDGSGKPFPQGVERLGKRWFISLSHSHGLVAAAVDTRPLGVDIQRMPALPAQRMRQMIRRFHPEEQQRLQSLPEGELPDAFCRLWACKESVMKFCGRGLSLPLSAFAVGEGDICELDGRRLGLTVSRWQDAYLACAQEMHN